MEWDVNWNLSLDVSSDNAAYIIKKIDPYRCAPHGVQYIFKFENGYGASVIKHFGSYGNEEDKWEIAVLKDDELCYDTPITHDTIGHLTDAEVDQYLTQIRKLTENEVQISRLRYKLDDLEWEIKNNLEALNDILDEINRLCGGLK